MKVWVENGPQSILDDPVKGFPFSLVLHEHAEGPEDAEWIFFYFGEKPFTNEVNAIFDHLATTPVYKKHKRKFVFQALADKPEFSRRHPEGFKFLLSPLANKDANLRHGVIAMPFHPCQADYNIQMSRDYTATCRALPKKHNFAFCGNITGSSVRVFHGGRLWIKKLRDSGLKYFYLRERRDWAFSNGWEDRHREWMQRIGESRYGFAPSDSSNSPRVFWTMQVGTIPILTDYEELPFWDEVEWRDIAVFVPSDQKLTFDYASLPMEGPEYEAKRRAVLRFWDQYCYYPSGAQELVRKLRERRFAAQPLDKRGAIE